MRDEAVKVAQKLRSAGISVETDVMARNMKKQLDYVNRSKIPYALFVGPKEVKKRKYTLKEMSSGEQASMSLERIVKEFLKARAKS